jgi:hypothetical protein
MTTVNSQVTAANIKSQLGGRINAAVVSTPQRLVPAAFLAGLISVENGKLDSRALRYEPHVLEKLRQVRDSVLLRSYNGIRRAQIASASDDALKALATSYSFTQIMGWHVLVAPLAEHSVAELRDPDKHLFFAVQLLEWDAGAYLKAKDYASVLRIWNTGRPNGKTFDSNYIANALAVMEAYRKL